MIFGWKMKVIHVLFCCAVVLFLSASAQAETEEILSYHSYIHIHQDASLTVTETIEVRATGNMIKRGIYRDFPTMYKSGGMKTVVGFDVLSVKRNGNREPHHTEKRENGVRVYIGQSSKMIPKGVHTYEISYRTDHQLGYFSDHDELYWNVTGQEWDFPIKKASAIIAVDGVTFDDLLNFGGYTGVTGSKSKNYDIGTDRDGHIKFYSTRYFKQNEGFTVYVEWPKGIIHEPTETERMAEQLSNNFGIFVGMGGFILVLLYYLIAWIKVGKDPEKGIIVPLFNAPDGLSPAAVRYVHRMGYDNECLSAAVINMAVKGVVNIEEKDGKFTLTLTGENEAELSADELKIKKQLFKSNFSIKLHQANHKKVSSAIRAFKESLSLKFETTYFYSNKLFFFIGLGLSVAVIVGGAVLSDMAGGVFIVLWLFIWSIGVFFLIFTVFSRWKAVLSGSESKFTALPSAVFMTIFSIPFVGGEFVGMYMMGQLTSPIMVVLLLLTISINVLFFKLLKAPTRFGRRIMDQIEGFKMFLMATEEDRLNRLMPVELTPELFEKMLPYALALGAENEWGDRFNKLLERTGQDRSAYSPMWYSGAMSSMTGGALASSLGSSLSGAISSSSHAPGSSSGSSGSSGGGGGGGGGGGW